MSFDKKYPNRKDHRQQYHDKKRRVDPECRPGGSCPACAKARKVKEARRRPAEDVE